MLIWFLLLSASSFFFNDTATTEIYTLSLHDALPISRLPRPGGERRHPPASGRGPHRRGADGDLPDGSRILHLGPDRMRSEEHTSELQSQFHLVCRLLLEKKNKNQLSFTHANTNASNR